MSATVVEVENLSKQYGRIVVVETVSFCVERGTTCAFLGANGAGKTTTIAMPPGLVVPSGGAIRIFGEDMLADR